MQYLADISIILWWLTVGAIFHYLGTDRLYRFYFGLIMWFLLFLVFNLQVKLVQLSGWIEMSGWQSLLVQNKKMILTFFAMMIPIFWFLFAFLDWEVKSNKVFSLLFGSFLPLFLLWILWYVFSHSSINLDFLEKGLSFFDNSFLFDIFHKAPKLIFSILLIIIFWKYIFAMILSFLWYIARLIAVEIRELKWEDGKKEEKVESKRIRLR